MILYCHRKPTTVLKFKAVARLEVAHRYHTNHSRGIHHLLQPPASILPGTKVSGTLEQQASFAKQEKEHFGESRSLLSEGGTRSGIAHPQPDKFSSPSSGEIGGGVGEQGGRQIPIDSGMLRVSSSTIESVREK
ncbi:hypothetical protein AVEN_9959-1 [Araneus ventricosus]|uniref:Uncharacterized protein n=1 Tax=Araneus ventricosus TaxID=182803 RepID=A0A4Y2F8V7_ARAVE|nr:hypothetical protein AVEN_9959-1 [Araneus ventricosus]